MAAWFDRITALHPALGRYFTRKLKLCFGMSTAANIAAFLCVCSAYGMICTADSGLIIITARAVMLIVWLQSAFFAGFRRQWFFLIFAVMFFLSPLALTAEQGSLYRISDALTRGFNELAGFFGLKDIYAALLWTAASTVLFVSGLFIRFRVKGSQFYCRVRLEQIGNR